jgi:hypothetical protein
MDGRSLAVPPKHRLVHRKVRAKELTDDLA